MQSVAIIEFREELDRRATSKGCVLHGVLVFSTATKLSLLAHLGLIVVYPVRKTVLCLS